MIRFDRVAVRYPRGARDAVADVSLHAIRGSLTAVVGPNGSGKSTLIRALIGRLPIARGTVSVDATSIADIPADALARRIAVITQREELAFPLLVSEYVALGRFPHLGIWHAAGEQDRTAIEESMAGAGVGGLCDRRVDALSGGEWQRVRLARALAQGGDALVLDEPTAFLDVGHEMAVFELLHSLARGGRAVLLVSHHLNLVARFADHMVLLHEGGVAAAGPPDTVMQSDTLERVYEWPLVVTRDPAIGAPALVPLAIEHDDADQVGALCGEAVSRMPAGLRVAQHASFVLQEREPLGERTARDLEAVDQHVEAVVAQPQHQEHLRAPNVGHDAQHIVHDARADAAGDLLDGGPGGVTKRWGDVQGKVRPGGGEQDCGEFRPPVDVTK